MEFASGFKGDLAADLRKAFKPVTEESHLLADASKDADRIILLKFSTAGVLVNANLEIVQFRGDTRPYLEHLPGEPSLNLLKMARNGLGLEVRSLVHDAQMSGKPTSKADVSLTEDGKLRHIKIEVTPLRGDSKHGFSLVMFSEQPSPKERKKLGPEPVARGKAADMQLSQLRNELAASKHHLQSIIEEQEATNEELQSTNEELTTVNDELQNRNAELSQLNNDLANLLSSVNIPIVMLGSDLRIRRFTPMAEKLLSLIPTDIGRPIGDIKPRMNLPNLEQIIAEVIDSVVVNELEVQDRDGHWYSVRIRPYKTRENKIDGASSKN